jgi:hypothetical protein
MRLRQVRMHRSHHRRRVVRAGDRKHRRMPGSDDILFDAQAPRHHDLAIFGERLADRLQ